MEGVHYNDLSSAKFKDTGDPNRTLTQEEKELLMRDLKIVHENFVDAVALNRGLPRDDVAALADGSSMLGDMAFQKGLIDRIGGVYEAREYLSERIGEPADICWY
jgi:protease-4